MAGVQSAQSRSSPTARIALLGDRCTEFVTHRELDPAAEEPMIAPLACSLIGQERTVQCVAGTRLADICGTAPFSGFHWCGYGLAERFVDRLTEQGLTVCASAPDAGVEAVELPGHPFLIATLFQPQVGATRTHTLHPLIDAFLAAAQEKTLPQVTSF
jgi:CTP synthase (UTP-ammonia lyase)